VRLLRLLAWRPLRRRPLRALLAIVAVAAGTAMAVSVFVVRSSVSESVGDFGAELAGPTELRVVGAVRRGGLEPEVVDRIAGAEGVAAAIPVVQAVAGLEGLEEETVTYDDGFVETFRSGYRRVLVLGVDCSVEALVGDYGCRDDAVADHGDVPFAVGRAVPDGSRLQTNHGMVTVRNRPVFDGFEGLGDGGFVVYPLPAAQRLFDRGDRVDVVYVQPEAGTDVTALRDRLDDLVGEHNGVLAADQGPPEVELALGSALPIFTLLGLFGLGIGGLLVHNTVTLSLEERRRELAVVGALGGTRRVVGWTALGEAGVLGAVGGVLGAAGGRLVAAPIVASMSNFTEDVAATPMELHVGVGSLVVGALLGVGVALAAAILPARRALGMAVAEELSGRGRHEERPTVRHLRRAGAWGLVVLVGVAMVLVGGRGGGLDPWQVPVGALGFAVVAVGLLLVGAGLAPVLIAPLGRVVGDSAAGRLAVANLLRAPGRTAVMVVALAGAMATAFVAAGFSRSVEESLTRSILTNMDGVSLTAAGEGANANLDVALPDDVVAALEGMPEVAEVRHGTVVLAGAGRDEVISVAAHDDPWVLKGQDEVVRGEIDPERFYAGEAVINTLLARDQDLRPGDRLRLPTPSGMAEVPVMAVIHSGGPTGREAVVSMATLRDLYGLQPVRALNLRPVPGVGYDELADQVHVALAASPEASRFVSEGPDRITLHLETPAGVVRNARGTVRTTMLPFWTLQQGLLGVAFVAILSTLLLVGVQRRREMGMLAAVGMTPPRLAQMVLAEAGIVGVVGVALGTLGGVVTLWAMLEVAPLVIGFSNPFRPDWSSVLTAGGLAVVVALAAAVWPARRAARTEVVPALRYE
jgi:putative ABC transport system permease protein